MAPSAPSISVIVPVYNDWHRVPVLLDCLARQTLLPEHFEILLIDNGSDAFQAPENPLAKLRILHCATPGSYAARNHGLEHARGTWLAFTDADCRPQADWLERLLEQAQAETPNSADQHSAASDLVPVSTEPSTQPSRFPPAQILAGQVRMTPSGPHPGPWEIHDLVKGIPQAWYVQRGYAATANLLVPAELANQLGGFDASRYSGGDAEFCRRAVAGGAGLRYVDAAIVEHPARATWAELAAKYRRIKGAQITHGSRRQRLIWTVRTFLPPVIAFRRFLGQSAWPLRHRLIACTVQIRLWGVEMAETCRLLLRTPPQR